MSLKTWKKEFYPITALQAHKTLDLVELVEHSIRKWIGLRPKNLKKHDLQAYNVVCEIYEINGSSQLAIDSFSCSLCRRFVDWTNTNEVTDKDCVGCPIFESRGKVRCYEYHDKETTHDSPYGMWRWESDPEPMIKALRKALRWAKRHS